MDGGPPRAPGRVLGGRGQADAVRGRGHADGIITGLRADLTDNVGAYLRPPEPSTLYRCFGNITGAYRIPAARIRARAVVTNKMPTGLNRGFGGQQLYFGLERLMDKVAAAAGLDPAEHGAGTSSPSSRTARRPAESMTPGTTGRRSISR